MRVQPQSSHTADSAAGRRRRVVHVVEPFATGPLHSIAKICCALGGDIDFTVIHGMRKDIRVEPAKLFPPDVRLISWNAHRKLSPRGDWRALQELKSLLRELQPDIVHAHSSKAGALARLAARSLPLKVVYSPRGYSFLRLDVGGAQRAVYFGLEAILGRIPHLTVACGVAEHASARRVANHVELVSNMIDFADFQEARELVRPNAPLTVAMCGEIRPQKNFPLFCEIARLTRDDEFRFLWLGGGDIPDGVTVPDNLEVSGWLSRQEVLARLATSHVFCQTSLWEGLPISLLEAMALGLPVLTYPAEGNSELVVDGSNGYICRQAEEFASRLTDLAADSERRLRLGRLSLRHVEQSHDLRSVAPLWQDIYENFDRYMEGS